MKAPGIPHNEADRLKALHELNLLDSVQEARFDRITRIAQAYFRVPIALITLVDTDRQWFKSCIGLDVKETPRAVSFCGHAIHSGTLLYVEDTFQDERFKDNPLVTGEPYIRFYAGMPIESPEGYLLGTLCVIDDQPKALSRIDIDVLEDLASLTNTEIARGSLLREKVNAISNEMKLQQLIEHTPWVVYGCRAFGRFDVTYVSGQIHHQVGYPSSDFLHNGSLWLDCIYPDDLERVQQSLRKVASYGENQIEYRIVHKSGQVKWVLDCQCLVKGENQSPFEIMGIRIDLDELKEGFSETGQRHS